MPAIASILSTLVTFSLVLASTRNSRYVVKEKHNVPQGWSQVGPAPQDTLLALRIALKQSNFNELERQLLEGLYS